LANTVGAASIFGLIIFGERLLWRRWHLTPKASGDRLAICVALLDEDHTGDLRRGVIATIARPLAGVEVLSAGMLLKEDAQGGILKAMSKARRLLKRKSGHVLVWGRVIREEGHRTVLELRFVSQTDESEGDRFSLTDKLLIEPKLLSEMGKVIATYAVATAKGKEARSYAARELLSLVSGLQQLLHSSQDGFRVDYRTQIRFAYGLLQSDIGVRSGNSDRLNEAVQAYRETLKEWTQEREPIYWVAAKSNLALALARLGKRESGSKTLKAAIASHRQVLRLGAGAQTAVDRAVTKSNLCVALTWLGEREPETETLKRAVAAGREALRELVRGDNQLEWALAKVNLGIALRTLGEREPWDLSLK
jgi:tetratricopeptide (TPR) repeat protein